jgi:hypothetical protein
MYEQNMLFVYVYIYMHMIIVVSMSSMARPLVVGDITKWYQRRNMFLCGVSRRVGWLGTLQEQCILLQNMHLSGHGIPSSNLEILK